MCKQALEHKLFIQFWSGVLDEESTEQAQKLISEVLAAAKKAIKYIHKVKIDNNAKYMLKALDILDTQNDILINSEVFKKLGGYFKQSIINFLYK